MSGATGVGPVDSVVAWSVGLVAIAGLGTLLWRVLRAVLRIADRVDQAWEDWAGSEGRPGVPARPGVMHRLGEHDQRLNDHEDRITRVETRLPTDSSS
ncbi:hypothetical protein [Streptomyces sp. NPDC018693]|uniref:hypothetical protein n=1 Tax=unclassified Streptomyces TaxID=2593676 RepID=UPI0037BD1A84